MFEKLEEDEKKRLAKLKADLESILVPRGLTVAIKSKVQPKAWHQYQIEINGRTKFNTNAYTSINFDSETFRIKFATGNIEICNWIADNFLTRPHYDMFNFGLAYFRRY